MTRIRMRDMRPDAGCGDTRIWFARHGLNWWDFLRNGIDIAALRATGDHADKLDLIEARAIARESGATGDGEI